MNEFLQLLFQGIALGGVYALIALGFTVVYRASKVINFSQGAMLLVGAYLISWLAVDKQLPFVLAVLLAMVALAGGATLFDTTVVRRVSGHSTFTTAMITIGVTIVVTASVSALFGSDQRLLGDPWGSSAVAVAGITLNWVRIVGIGVTAAILLAYFLFDRRSRYGLALRATAADPEAAMSVGVPVQRIHAMTWAIAGVVATLGGLFLAGFPNSPNPTLGDSALRAFPAIILGGLESPVGAVIGGVIIAVVEVLTSGYAPSSLGTNFYEVAPYVVMILVLLVRPYGLFGTRPVERP